MNKKWYTHIFTTSQAILLGSHELGNHSVVVISLLLVVQLSGAAGEVCVVIQDELEASFVGGVAVGAVVRLHGDLDQGGVADLRAAVGGTAARHVRPAIGVTSATWAATIHKFVCTISFLTIFTDIVCRAVLAVVIGGIADFVGTIAVGIIRARLLAFTVLTDETLLRNGLCQRKIKSILFKSVKCRE